MRLDGRELDVTDVLLIRNDMRVGGPRTCCILW